MNLYNRLIDKLTILIWERFCRCVGDRIDRRTLPVGKLPDGCQATAATEEHWNLIQVEVGTTRGAVSDLRRVGFTGKQLASCQSFQRREILYKTPDGLVVHVRVREKLAGFPTEYSLQQVEEWELDEGGIFEELGRGWHPVGGA